MASPDDRVSAALAIEDETALREILGYLNFSSGASDPRFQQNLNRLCAWLKPEPEQPDLRALLENRLARLERESPAFSNSLQSKSVLTLLFDQVLPAYRRHHRDLLFHVAEEEFVQPFFVARAAEAVLAQGPPWDETERITSGALNQLNDFLGHRPVAVLENGRQMQPYAHERFRPLPLYIRGAGVVAGRHQGLIEQALQILAAMPGDILAAAYFDPAQLDELALDLRAYDHAHPVYKRTNYTFGEWDPHCLDISGRYRRFVVRSIILEALHDWMADAEDVPADERVSEAAAVLAGTILMASSVSGSGPDTHDSNVSLTSLLPKIARQRDAFYTRLLQSLPGKHGERLRREAQLKQQPFGRIRQHLNLYLAHYGCRQMQRAHLASIYARMGQADAAREQAAAIPSAATRFETEIQLRLTRATGLLDQGQVVPADTLCGEVEELFHRGIECGALVDPWNVLGFQGQFPLFAAREDSVADQRIDKLLALMEGFFNVQSRLLCETAAQGERELCRDAGVRFRRIAGEWDRFATTTVSDLPAVSGAESCDSAERVTRALIDWHDAGGSSGDVAFWKRHLDDFQSPRSYAIVVDLLLRKRDLLTAINLLIQWLSESDRVALEAGAYSFNSLLRAWVAQAVGQPVASAWPLIRKSFDYLEANSGDWGTVPGVWTDPQGDLRLGMRSADKDAAENQARRASGEDERPVETTDELEDEETEDSIFRAAYENVVFRDSAADGNFGDTVDDPTPRSDTDLDQIAIPVEQRLRFLVTLSQAWGAIAEWSSGNIAGENQNEAALESSFAERSDVVRHWLARNETLRRDLGNLMDELSGWQPAEPDGDPESLGEFDRQLHVKLSLLNSAISAGVALSDTSRALRCLVAAGPTTKTATGEALAREVLQAIARGDVPTVRKHLTGLQKELQRQPLLYEPLDHDGAPREILAVRNRQSLLRTLLTRLPELGLLRETWHLLRTAYVMERTSPPGGMSITEFDRLLEAALKSSLECIISATGDGSDEPKADEQLVRLFERVLEMYLRLWLKHSSTMRLSSAEALKENGVWRRVKSFIRKYGGDLFHTRMLTMGNLRGIVQRGADAYLAWLAEEEDPLHPVRLLRDIGHEIDREEAAFLIETILRCIVEKFDRFLEYNTTTTQSDYGDQLHCLLDFLRLEADYERQAWNLLPLKLAHEVLARRGRDRAAGLWREDLARKTSDIAKSLQQKLRRLERQHGMRLPSVSDRLTERFIKPLDLDRMLALVRPAMREARDGHVGEAFARLRDQTERYLVSSSGSALEPQPWLQSLSEELEDAEDELLTSASSADAERLRPVRSVNLAEIRRQLQIWEKSLDSNDE